MCLKKVFINPIKTNDLLDGVDCINMSKNRIVHLNLQSINCSYEQSKWKTFTVNKQNKKVCVHVQTFEKVRLSKKFTKCVLCLHRIVLIRALRMLKTPVKLYSTGSKLVKENY